MQLFLLCYSAICMYSVSHAPLLFLASSLPADRGAPPPTSADPPPGQTLRGHCRGPKASLETSSVLFLEVSVTTEFSLSQVPARGSPGN